MSEAQRKFLKKLKLRKYFVITCQILIVIGFFGLWEFLASKNLINTLPIYLGVFIHCYFRRIPIRNFIVITLFSSGISPLVSFCFFSTGLPYYFSVPLGIFCGIVAGFLLPSLVEATMNITGGYNLYNVGFALGLISVFFYGIFKLFNLNTKGIIKHIKKPK